MAPQTAKKSANRTAGSTTIDHQSALSGYKGAARQGVFAVSRSMVLNKEWLDLDLEMKKRVIEMWKLERKEHGTTADAEI